MLLILGVAMRRSTAFELGSIQLVCLRTESSSLRAWAGSISMPPSAKLKTCSTRSIMCLSTYSRISHTSPAMNTAFLLI